MKALSVKQPWANLIAAGTKTIETRTWATPYRGPLLIVSSRRPSIEPAGCVVALVRLAGCRRMVESDEGAACCRVYPRAQAWLLRDIRRIEPVPVRGALGIFDCPVRFEDLRFV